MNAQNKQLIAATRALSFSALRVLRGFRWLSGLLRVLFVYPQGLHKSLNEAEQQRRELSSHPSLWLK